MSAHPASLADQASFNNATGPCYFCWELSNRPRGRRDHRPRQHRHYLGARDHQNAPPLVLGLGATDLTCGTNV